VCAVRSVGRSGGGKKREGEECRVAGGGSIVNELQGGVSSAIYVARNEVYVRRGIGEMYGSISLLFVWE
jgi:hypothetical protein